MLGVWLLAMLVVTRSYESNLMSRLAVRYMAQPYQSLRDVLDDPSVGMVWHKQGALMQAIMVSQRWYSLWLVVVVVVGATLTDCRSQLIIFAHFRLKTVAPIENNDTISSYCQKCEL